MLIYEPCSWFDISKLIQPKDDIVVLLDRTVFIDHSKSILINLEPEAIVKHQDFIIKNHDKFTYILTFNEKILKNCPNAIKYIYGTSWIKPEEYDAIDPSTKKFEISTIIGNKMLTIGHSFRRQVFYNRHLLQSKPMNIFLSHDANFFGDNIPEFNNNRCQDTKIVLFKNSQFHLVIENSRQINYFTEKLLDALITYTIPIYYGCPNIQDYFDTSGWILIESESVEEVARKIQVLDETYYQKYMDTMIKNREKAIALKDIYSNINDALKRIPNF